MRKVNKLFYLAIVFILFFLFNFGERVRAFDEELPTTVSIIIVCGDGFKSVDEVCDKGDLSMGWAADFGTAVCADYEYAPGSYYNAGYLICADDCQAIMTNMCSYCPNSIMEGIEECDGTDFGGRTCQTYGYREGTLSCTPTCHLNLENCSGLNTQVGGTAGGNSGRGGGGSGSPTGYDPGSDVPQQETKVAITGKAYPGSDVHILMDGKIVGIVKADSAANFNFETKEVTPGVASFSFWSEDSSKVKSVTITLTFRVISSAVTTITGAYLPPTISADKLKLNKSESITFTGQTIPNAQVFVYVNSEEQIIKNATSTTAGAWSLVFDSSPLAENEYHTAKALFQVMNADNDLVKSGYSNAVNFLIGEASATKKCEGADLNGDNRVNLTDFSIMLYYWNTENECADQNANGKVDLVDFSIMMYNWTG